MQKAKSQKRTKKIVVLLLILLALAALVIWWRFHFYVGLYQKVQTSTIEEIQQDANKADEDLQNKLQQLLTESPAAVKTPEPPADNNTATKKDYNAALQRHHTALESASASFAGRLEGIVQSAKEEFYALPPEQRTTTTKVNIVMSKRGALEALQSESDATVASEVKAIRQILKESGQDTSLADQIQQAYENVKSAKIAEYMSRLNS